MTTQPISLAAVNAMSRDEFVQSIGRIFDHSSWIADAAWQHRPFASIEALHTAMMDVIIQAGPERQTDLIVAHPELGALKAARDSLTAESRREQSGAGFDLMSPEEARQLDQLNRDYKARFGFPFIMAVKGKSRQEILAAMRARMMRSASAEFALALAEIAKISSFRLHDLIRER